MQAGGSSRQRFTVKILAVLDVRTYVCAYNYKFVRYRDAVRAPPQAEPPAAAPEPALRTGLSLTGALLGAAWSGEWQFGPASNLNVHLPRFGEHLRIATRLIICKLRWQQLAAEV